MPSTAAPAACPGGYFGPFASAGAVNRTINALQKAFLRPLLLRQRVREPHPAVPALSDQALLGALHRRDLAGSDHATWSQEAEAFLGGRSQLVKAELAEAMEQAAERLDFEQAARYRDRISAMSFVTAQQGINPEAIEEADVFGLAQEGGQTCIQVFFFRAGQNWGNRAYFPRADKQRSRPARSSAPSWRSSMTTSRCRSSSCCRMRPPNAPSSPRP